MRILMLGWEFPPHISGGLGTACFGITRGLIKKGNDIVFIMPTTGNLSEIAGFRFRSASGVSISKSLRQAVDDVRQRQKADEFSHFYYHPVRAHLSPYGSYDFGQIGLPPTTDDVLEVSHLHGGYQQDIMDEVERFCEAAAAVVLDENAKQRADVLHVHDWMTYPAGIIASRLSGLPFVAHIHATEFDRCGDHGYDKIYNIEREGLRAADHIIAVSERTKEVVVKRYGISPYKISVVYNGIFPHEKEYQFSVPSAIKEEKRILFMGRVTYQKGPEFFVEAARMVLEEMPDVRFIMAGNGDLLPSMIRRVAELRMGDRFHFTGFLRGEDVPHLYSISSLFVMPSISEPFGIAPLEAIQCGVPVLISKQSGCAEVLPDAFSVDFWDIRKMADTILDVLRHPEKAEQSYQNCRAVLSNLTWDNAAVRIMDAYARVCPTKRS